ncbi:MAG: ammonium transporter, partial [Firmicutes bacterium]|nr:ammonium transporter [Bacillota bacterium]
MKKLFTILSLCLLMMMLVIPVAFADGTTPEPAKIDTGDTTFVLISAALVMIMTPGLALFYGGMVRTKNALTTIM